jgi:Methylamine utilisation protein MauE
VVGASVAVPLVSVPAAVLVVAGVGKLRAPAAAAEALRGAGLPSGWGRARAVGAVEAAVGAFALAAPSPPVLVLAAALYAALAAFAVRLLRSAAPVASCGCFGADAPPSRLHAGFDVAGAAILGLAALSPPAGVPALAARAPLAGVGLVAGCAAAAYAVTLVLGHLPQAAAAYRPRREAA